MGKTTTRKSQIKKILKRDLVSNRKYKTTYKDIYTEGNYDSDKFFSGKGTPDERTKLLKLQNKALRAPPNSPMQKEIRKEINALRKEMGMRVNEELYDFDKEQPMKSTVAVPGYGTMSIDGLMKNLVQSVTELLAKMKQGTDVVDMAC